MSLRKSFILIIFFLNGLVTIAQYIPVIKSNSRNVTIRDGLHLMQGNWYLLPEKKPDVYYVEIPRKEHRVTFITDSDSISFDVNYGGEYDFIILYKNKDSCHTRIITKYKSPVPYRSNQVIPGNDTIPFKMGDNSKIYLTGKLNDSGPVDIQFDLGNSGALVINKSSLKTINIQFDDSITLSNSDGVNVVPFSTSNRLMIAGLTWDSMPAAVADNMTHREDLVAGNYLFQDKIIEIDYDKKILVLHDSLPVNLPSYSKLDIVLDNGIVPIVPATLFFRSKKKEGWFIFDTGAYTTILSGEDVSFANKMIVEAKKMVGSRNKALNPELAFGKYHFSGFNYTTQKLTGNGISGLLGNDLLKRFNIILNNKNGELYLKPNTLVDAPYANPEFYAVRVGAAIIVLLTGMAVFFVYRRKKRKHNLKYC